MWPAIHGRGERIPIHLSFAPHELVNRPENVSKDIHRAAKPPAICLIHNENLSRFTAFTLALSRSHFYTIEIFALFTPSGHISE